jgi:hypothetical protein
MADEVKPAAPKTAEDYINAALSASAPDKTETKEPEAKADVPEKKAEESAEVPKKAPETPKTPEKEPEKKAEPKDELAGHPPNLRKSFEKLAAEKAALRAERQAIEAERKYGPAGERAARAAAAGDTLGVLAAYGLKYENAAEAVVQKASEPAQPKAPEANPLETRLERLERELQGERNQRARIEVTAKLQEVLKANDTDFGLINEMEAHGDVLHELEMYMAQHGGRPPGDTFEESVSIAAELVQDRYMKEKARWMKVLEKERNLTKVKEPATVPDAVEKSAGNGSSDGARVVKTLSNSLASSPGGAARSSSKIKSEEDYIAEAMNVLQTQAAE